MNRSIKDFFTASLFFALCSTAYFTQAQTASNVAQSAIMKPTDLLVKEIAGQSQMMQNLEEMCDGIGPRLTGSEQLRKAQAWAIEKLKSYGAVNVHEEAYAFGRPWSRGTTSARLLNANGQRLNIEQKAWTSGTAGKITAEVALLDVKTLAEFKVAAPKLKNKIVLLVKGLTPPEDVDRQKFKEEYEKAINQAQFAATLLISENKYNFQHMHGVLDPAFKHRTGIIIKDDAALLMRLVARGITPKLELNMGGGFGAKPVFAYNVVADIIGTETPDEMVIVGAHQDSWDLSTGATDNGVGVVEVMEILRAMQATGLKPKRSLRIVLFSGEEQGLLGSQAYVKQHATELAKIQAVLVQDAGGGRIKGFLDMEVDAWSDALEKVLVPAQALGDIPVIYKRSGGSDHLSFLNQGIPSFGPLQSFNDYWSHTYHTQFDSIDHVNKVELVQATQVMAVVAWGLLNGERLPHQAPEQGKK